MDTNTYYPTTTIPSVYPPNGWYTYDNDVVETETTTEKVYDAKGNLIKETTKTVTRTKAKNNYIPPTVIW